MSGAGIPPCSFVKRYTMSSISCVLIPMGICLATSSRIAVLSSALFLIFSIWNGVFKILRVGTISPRSACIIIFSSIGIWHFLYFLPLPHQHNSFLSMILPLLKITYFLSFYLFYHKIRQKDTCYACRERKNIVRLRFR